MESITAIAQEYFIFLLNSVFGTDIIFRALPYAVHTKHYTFIGNCIEIVNTRIYFWELWMARLLITWSKPVNNVLICCCSVCSMCETYSQFRICIFKIRSRARRHRSTITHTQCPYTSKRIIES